MSHFRVFVPASIGNVGPGFDCLGMCVDGLGDVIMGTAAPEVSILKVTGKQSEAVPIDPEKNTASIAASHLFSLLDYSGGVEISIERNLPLSGGMGASAASAVGGAMLAAAICGLDADDPRILRAALKGEAQVAGHHLDNIGPCLYGGLVIVRSLEPIDIVPVPTKVPWWITIYSPFATLSTKKAREVLPKTLDTATWVAQCAHTACLVQAFITGDEELFRKAFQDHFAEPIRAPLIEDFDQIKGAALSTGAMGCSISGGGPSIFAVSDSKDKANRIGEAMGQASTQSARIHVGRICHKGAHYE